MSELTEKDLIKQGWIRIDDWHWQSPLGTGVITTEKALQVAKDERWLTVLAIFGRGEDGR